MAEQREEVIWQEKVGAKSLFGVEVEAMVFLLSLSAFSLDLTLGYIIKTYWNSCYKIK